jgi:hypothetical protein
MTQRSFRTICIVGLGFGLALLLAAGVLIVFGAQRRGVDAGLLATARLAFLVFWPCYVAGSLVSLFGPAFMPLRRIARDLGLAFAAVEVVHLSLVARLCAIGDAPSLATFLFFGSAAIATLIIACLSFDFASQYLHGPVNRAVRWVGMNLIGFAFAVDFWRDPLGGGPAHVLAYLPFVALVLVAAALRLLAMTKYLDRTLKHSPYSTG